MAGVRLEGVSKRFGDVKALNSLSLEAQDGEFLVLVGPSGCGKTTALRLVAGLEEISEGEIYIGDRRVNDVAPKNRNVAMVFQSYALYPHMSVYDNMAFSLKLAKRPKAEIEQRVRATAEVLGLDGLLARKPKQLSGGQRQRVALGRAIIREPQVFLMDEPLSNLDAQLRVQTRAELIKLHQRLQTTVIYVTHDQVEAMTMGTRIAVMRDGLLQQLDTPQVLYDQPANMFVAGFIGSPAMNFLDGRLVAQEDDVYMESGPLRLCMSRSRRSSLLPHVGHELYFGIRPENIHHHSERQGASPEAAATLRVTVVEPLGSEKFVYMTSDNQELTARMDSRVDVRPGQDVAVIFETDKLHVFDRQTEQALPA